MEVQKNKKILEHIEKAVDFIESSEIEEAVSTLKFCEDLLNLRQELDIDLYLLVFHNLALCHQMTENLEKCEDYLEKTIILAKSLDSPQEIMKIRNFRYISMLQIQKGAINSFFGKASSSLSSAQKAFKYILESFQVCLDLASSTDSLSEYQKENCRVLECCLSYLQGKSKSIPTKSLKIMRRTSLGVIHFTDWIFSYSLNDLLRIKPLKFFEIKNFHTYVAEISKDFMLEKICLLCAACYMIASNKRALCNSNILDDGKDWHEKAVVIGKALLPIESPLFLDIKESFDRHYPDLTIQKVKVPVLESRKSLPKCKKTPETSYRQEKPIKQLKNEKSERKTKTPDIQCISDRRKTPDVNLKAEKKVKVMIHDGKPSEKRPKTPVLMKPPKCKLPDQKIISDRSYFKLNKKVQKKTSKEGKFRTLREENREPEPQISGDYRESAQIN